MRISTRLENSAAVIAFEGRLDIHSAEAASQAVRRAMDGLVGDLVLDFAKIEHIGSAGLQVIVMAQKMMADRPGQLKIVKASAFARRVFEMGGLTHLLSSGDQMSIRIWGARGSLPSPLTSDAVAGKIVRAMSAAKVEHLANVYAARQFVQGLPALQQGTAGGHTSCVEVRAGDSLFILDAGTGIRPLGLQLMSGPFGQGQGRAFLLISHTHWDHIMGLPFFTPAYVRGNRVEVCGGHEDLMERLRAQQQPEFFPVQLDEMGADFTFRLITEGQHHDLGGVVVRTTQLDHPGGSFGYRLEYGGKSLVYATDVEIREFKAETLDRYIDFFAETDVLIFDSQYSLEDSVNRQDWGHSSSMIGAEIAAEANAKTFLMFHHEPTASDDALERSLETTRAYLKQTAPDVHCAVHIAREGLALTLSE